MLEEKIPNEEMTKRLVKLSQGIPGAITVFRLLMRYPKFEEIVSYLEKENINGSQLWMVYKDECKFSADETWMHFASLADPNIVEQE